MRDRRATLHTTHNIIGEGESRSSNRGVSMKASLRSKYADMNEKLSQRGGQYKSGARKMYRLR